MTRRPTLAVYLGVYVPILILALGIPIRSITSLSIP